MNICHQNPLINRFTTYKEDRVLDTLTDLVVPKPDDSESLRVVKYSPKFRLAFSLLNEDAASGHAILSWDVKDAIERE